MKPLPVKTISHYRIVAPIGAGGLLTGYGGGLLRKRALLELEGAARRD